MANVIPGFIYKPISHAGRPKRRKGRGLVGHVAVSNSPELRPWDANDWHAYLPKEGPGIQYVDLDYVAFTNYDGSYSLASFESQGGMGTSAELNAEPWTDNQIRLAATFLRHLHDTEGVPLEVMPDSRVTSRGFGTHRLGIDPWRVEGGERWTRHYGKECPGNRKHEQRFDVVRLAAGLDQEDDVTPEDIEAIAQRTRQVIADGSLPYGLDNLRRRLEALSALVRPETLADAIVAKLPTGDGGSLSKADVEDAIRSALGSLDNT